MQEEESEQRSRLRTAERDRVAVPEDFDRAEKSKLHRSPPACCS
jgi:hypothetical protein